MSKHAILRTCHSINDNEYKNHRVHLQSSGTLDGLITKLIDQLEQHKSPNDYLLDPVNFAPYRMMRCSISDIGLMSITCIKFV